jgi:hypothetical protein
MNTNDFEYGVITDDLSINVATVENENVVLSSDQILNQLFVGISQNKLDEVTSKDIYTIYKRVVCLCARDNFVADQDAYKIYNKVLTIDEYKNLSKYFTLVPMSVNVLKDKQHHANSLKVNRNFLEQFNNSHITLENDEIVLQLLEVKESVVRMYSNMYDSQYSVSQLNEMISLANYYLKDFRGPISKQLSNMITTMKESDFWVNSYNCNINLTDSFMERGFQYKESTNNAVKGSIVAKGNDKDKDVDGVINKLSNLDPKKSEYDLQNIYRKDEYTDILNALQKSNRRTYYAVVDKNHLAITKEQVTELFSKLTVEKEIYDIFNTLLISKDYCHMVLNNPEVLTKVAPIIEKYKPLYKYLFGYAWLCFYTEECIFKTKSNKNSRFVFDIKTASKLPSFPFCTEDIYQNPYITTLVADKVIDGSNNCLSLPMIENHDGYGIATLDDFKWRFNVFTTGDPTKNILDGINWENFAVSGSIIPACLQKKSPLFDFVSSNAPNIIDKWLTFFNHYYSESDIDLMNNKESVFAFMNDIKDVIAKVKKNLSSNDSDDAKIEVEPIKTLAISVNTKYLIEKLDDIRERCDVLWSVDDIIKNIKSDNIKEYFYKLYTDAKYDMNCKHRKQYVTDNSDLKQLYGHFYKPSSIDDMNVTVVTYDVDKENSVKHDSDMSYYINDFRSADNKVPDEENLLLLKISENIKFKIRSPKMLHPIEAFRVKNGDFFSTVARFHLPCVRAYLTMDDTNKNEVTIKLLASCVTALMTGINIDYKYFAGLRDPIEILNKYRMRGFSTLLNDSEKQHMLFYNGNINKNNGQFYIKNIKDKVEAAKFFGAKDVNDDLFKPMSFSINKEVGKNAYPVKNYKYVKTLADLQDFYKTKHKYDVSKSVVNMFKLRTITSDGYVAPLQRWVSDAYYSMTTN